MKNPTANAICKHIHLIIAKNLCAYDLDSRAAPPAAEEVNQMLQCIAFALRATYHTTLSTTPGQVVFGHNMIVSATYIANWQFLYECRCQLIDNK
eukprot:13983275-Ditylum_brightwellii.AAC.1